LRRRGLLAAAAMWATVAHAQTAAPAELATDLPGARLQGSGRLRFLGLRIYDARLWMAAQPVGKDFGASPFALEIEYARELKGEQIAERSLAEMRRQGDIAEPLAARWLTTLKQLIPDVKGGDRITGVHLPGAGARIYLNGSLRGEPRDTEFARLFFGIWLSPRTSEPTLRDALLGRAAP
jgi:hypothetical protein